MNNMKKFFAFSIATAMVAGTVWGVTPGIKALADGASSSWWDSETNQYTEVSKNGYTQVWQLPNGKYANFDYSSLKLGTDNGTIKIGDTTIVHIFSINNTFNKDAFFDDIIFESSNTNVATVNDVGEVTGVGVGEAKITCKYIVNGYTITFEPITIKVLSSDTKQTLKVTFAPKNATLYSGEYTNIVATVEGLEFSTFEKMPGLITFKSSNESVAYVSGRSDEDDEAYLEIGGYKPGTATIVAEIGDYYRDYYTVDSEEFTVTVRTESSKQNATPVDPTAPTSESQAKQEQTPESIENYQKWLATYGGGTTAAAGTTAVSGTVGQPGSEVIVNTGAGEPVAMFQSTDASNTLLAAPVGVVPTGSKLTTLEADKNSAEFKAAANKIKQISRRGSVLKVYGIGAVGQDGQLLTSLNGKAAISLPIPTDINVPAGMELHSVLIKDDGTATRLETLVSDGRIVFGTDAFGTIAFIAEKPIGR